MRLILFVTVLISLPLCSACTSVQVAPVATATGVVNQEDLSITETHNGVAFTVKLDELSVAPYQHVNNITSFHVTIDNQSDMTVSYPSESFLLKDGDGRQYSSITPERVREIVSKETVYLIPYPYVGYYYLKDQAMVSHADSMSSEIPFYAEYHPQDIFTRALTREPVLKRSNVSGVIYFIADLERVDSAEVQVFSSVTKAGEPIARLPFSVTK